MRRGCAQRGCFGVVRLERHKAFALCAKVVRALCALRVPSLVRFERHKGFALFRTALLALHKAFDPCAQFIALKFSSVKYSIGILLAITRHHGHV